jgi:hypothetical protein
MSTLESGPHHTATEMLHVNAGDLALCLGMWRSTLRWTFYSMMGQQLVSAPSLDHPDLTKYELVYHVFHGGWRSRHYSEHSTVPRMSLNCAAVMHPSRKARRLSSPDVLGIS